MTGSKAIAGLIKWTYRPEWQEGFEEAIACHMGPAFMCMGIEADEVEPLIGGLFGNLWGCIFEDFLTWEDEGGNCVVDDYLKRHGWKESASDKTYLAGLRDSVLSLYEISDVVPGESCLMRDLIRGGEPIRVNERSGTRSFKPWDRVAARLVPVRSKIVLGGGVLIFRHELCEEALQSFHRMKDELRRDGGRRPVPISAVARPRNHFRNNSIECEI